MGVMNETAIWVPPHVRAAERVLRAHPLLIYNLTRWFMATGRMWNGTPGGRVVTLAAAGGGASVTDVFTGSGTLNGTTTTTGSKTWSVLSGTWDLSTVAGNVTKTAANNVNETAVIDFGSATMDVSITFGSGTDGNISGSGLCVRAVDNSNKIIVIFNSSGPRVDVYKCVSGAFTLLQSSGTVTSASGSILRAAISANNYVVYWNGSSVLTFSEATHNTATKCGIHASHVSVSFDYFSVT